MAQEQRSHSRQETKAPADETAQHVGEAATKEGLDQDVDAILADIDQVLETNAEEFVKSYIQKGGQ